MGVLCSSIYFIFDFFTLHYKLNFAIMFSYIGKVCNSANKYIDNTTDNKILQMVTIFVTWCNILHKSGRIDSVLPFFLLSVSEPITHSHAGCNFTGNGLSSSKIWISSLGITRAVDGSEILCLHISVTL